MLLLRHVAENVWVSLLCCQSNLDIEVFSISLYLRKVLLQLWRIGCRNRSGREVKSLEIAVNFKQMVAFIWTLIAVIISLIIVFAPFKPFSVDLGQWQMSVLLFFTSLLLLTLPVYLLLAIWHVLGERIETD